MRLNSIGSVVSADAAKLTEFNMIKANWLQTDL